MAEYDLVEPMKDVKKLMERFDTLDLQNVKDVLECFMILKNIVRCLRMRI